MPLYLFIRLFIFYLFIYFLDEHNTWPCIWSMTPKDTYVVHRIRDYYSPGRRTYNWRGLLAIGWKVDESKRLTVTFMGRLRLQPSLSPSIYTRGPTSRSAFSFHRHRSLLVLQLGEVKGRYFFLAVFHEYLVVFEAGYHIIHFIWLYRKLKMHMCIHIYLNK